MQKTTFAKMLQWIEQPFQTTVARERSFLVKQANKIRRILYDLYTELELDVDIEECFEVQDFGHCSGCQKDTVGVTLPAYMQNVEAAWFGGDPLNLYSKWREYKVGVKTSSDCLRAVYDMPGTFPTERELCPSNSYHCVQLMAKNKADKGKEVIITYESEDGRRDDSVILTNDGYTKLPRMAKQILSVILPTNLTDEVIIAQSDDENKLRILSEYQPWEHVPSYRRVKITGVDCNDVVVVRASRKYTDLCKDNDIVETDNIIAIENAARYLFYSESGTGQELRTKASDHHEMMRKALIGAQSRDRGNKSDDLIGPGPPVKRSRLRRQRRGHNLH